MSITVREAAPDDRIGIRRVLDAAMLDVRDDLPERIEDGDVLIATAETGRVLGALVLVPRDRDWDSDDDWDHDCNRNHDRDGIDAHGSARVDAIAVRRARRGQGVGSALIRAAAERHDRLTAEFDPGVRPFYESLGFEITPAQGTEDHFSGELEPVCRL